jgi:hypothetical protein
MISKPLLLLSHNALTKTSVACLVSATLIGCGGGGGDTAGDVDTSSRQLVVNATSLVERPPLAFVERDISAPEATATRFSPYSYTRNARLILRDSLDAGESVGQADLFAREGYGWASYDAKDISVSPDGKKMLFAAIGPEDAANGNGLTWNIFEYNHDTGALRRVIADDAIAREGNDVGPVYGPNGEIVFSSDRSSGATNSAVTTIEQDGQICYQVPQSANGGVLHLMTDSGDNIETLTRGLHYDVEPTMMSDGQITFVRVSEPSGGDSAGVEVQLMRIDLSDRQTDLLYPSEILTGEYANLEIDKLAQAEDGSLMALVRHRQAPQNGGAILSLGAPSASQSDGSLGSLAPTPLRQAIDDILPGNLSQLGWSSAFGLAYDGSGRVIEGWSQCILTDGVADFTCDTANSGLTPKINYGMQFVTVADLTVTPLLDPAAKVYTDISLMQRQISSFRAAWPHEPATPDYENSASPETLICEDNEVQYPFEQPNPYTPVTPEPYNPDYNPENDPNYNPEVPPNNNPDVNPDNDPNVNQNQAPIANAGRDQAAVPGQEITLDGTASSDPDGDTLTFNWQAPEGVVLEDGQTPTPKFTVGNPGGVYSFTLTVSDGMLTSEDVVVVSTDNLPPVAEAGNDVVLTEGESIQLNGSDSYDPEGQAITYSWILNNVNDGMLTLAGPDTAMPTVTAVAAGEYIVDLVVNDGLQASQPDQVKVTVKPLVVNQAPTANAGDDQKKPIQQMVTLDGTGSADPEKGSEINYVWSLVYTPPGSEAVLLNPTSAQPQFMPDTVGIYTVQLVVNDGELSSQPDTVNVEIYEPVINPDPNNDDDDDDDKDDPKVKHCDDQHLYKVLPSTGQDIWPPNHRLVCMTFEVHTTDACGDNAPNFDLMLSLMDATSNQPDNATGDGNTVDDVQINGNELCVRAERQGGDKNGRIYTAYFDLTDGDGNVTQTQTKIYVRHSQGNDDDGYDDDNHSDD